MRTELNHRPLVAAGTLLGIGLGGFVDGILFHQLLQIHHMLSAIRPATTLVNVEINMFWDGLFHVFTWLTTVLGLAVLWSAVKRQEVPLSDRTFLGSLILGWGIFNLVEGIIDHHLLGLHHVVEALGVSGWDYAFLAWGALLILLGSSLVRTGARNSASVHARPTHERRTER